MPTRDLSNRRIQIWLGLASAIADPEYDFTTAAELGAMLMAAPVIRWDGLDFGAQASEQIDDRSLDDDATSTLRGFMQFGGSVPFFFPKPSDTTGIARQVFNLVKTKGTELALVERIGWVDRRVAGTAGDEVNIYKVMTDGFMPDTEGTGGYAYIQSMIPRGIVAPKTIVADSPAAAVTISGGAIAGAAGGMALRRATYLGNDITQRATWTSDDPTVAIVRQGIVEMIATGTADITASFPGGTTSTAVTVTVS